MLILKSQGYVFGCTHDRGSTLSASARRRVDDRSESRTDTASRLKTLKIVTTAAMSGARHKY